MKNLLKFLRQLIYFEVFNKKIIYYFLIIINFIFSKFNKISYFLFLSKILSERRVQGGLFKGMIYYQSQKYMNGGFMPRVLGVYEMQLTDWIKESFNKKYDDYINVGSAEGYYSLGYLYKNKDINLTAIDIDKKAIDFLSELAKANKVFDRLNIFHGDAKKYFTKIDKNKRYFILSDCEGFEKELFNTEIIKNLGNSDILIEMHYTAKSKSWITGIPDENDRKYADAERKEFLKKFESTHTYSIKKSLFPKAEEIKLLENVPSKYISKILYEKRFENQEWLMLTSKSAIKK